MTKILIDEEQNIYSVEAQAPNDCVITHSFDTAGELREFIDNEKLLRDDGYYFEFIYTSIATILVSIRNFFRV